MLHSLYTCWVLVRAWCSSILLANNLMLATTMEMIWTPSSLSSLLLLCNHNASFSQCCSLLQTTLSLWLRIIKKMAKYKKYCQKISPTTQNPKHGTVVQKKQAGRMLEKIYKKAQSFSKLLPPSAEQFQNTRGFYSEVTRQEIGKKWEDMQEKVSWWKSNWGLQPLHMDLYTTQHPSTEVF